MYAYIVRRIAYEGGNTMRYEDDGFDPTPYDRILSGIHTSKNSATANAEDINAYKTARQNGEMRQDSLSQIDDING